MFPNWDDERNHGARRRGPDFERGPRGPEHGRGPDRGRGRDRGMGMGRGMGHGGRGMGPGFPFNLAAMFGRGPAVRRGDVRSAVLALLDEGPMHGYQIMQELSERSGGMWRPSAGSVYPTLQQLEDEGLVRGEERDGRRVFALTDAGRTAAKKALEAGAPWEVDRSETSAELNTLVMHLVRATMQVRNVGSNTALSEARKILIRARRDMYRLLAEDDVDEEVELEDRPAAHDQAEATEPAAEADEHV